ncbi:MAG: hypothetical protein IJF19_04100 [Clostridia bacterium]|nr:hypothetical protein [Clostridia bacterium]
MGNIFLASGFLLLGFILSSSYNRYSAFGFNGYNTWNSKCVTDDCGYPHKKNKTQEK